jgi:hypothetical protein
MTGRTLNWSDGTARIRKTCDDSHRMTRSKRSGLLSEECELDSDLPRPKNPVELPDHPRVGPRDLHLQPRLAARESPTTDLGPPADMVTDTADSSQRMLELRFVRERAPPAVGVDAPPDDSHATSASCLREKVLYEGRCLLVSQRRDGRQKQGRISRVRRGDGSRCQAVPISCVDKCSAVIAGVQSAHESRRITPRDHQVIRGESQNAQSPVSRSGFMFMHPLLLSLACDYHAR